MGPVVIGGDNMPSPGWNRVTDLPNIGGGGSAVAPLAPLSGITEYNSMKVTVARQQLWSKVLIILLV